MSWKKKFQWKTKCFWAAFDNEFTVNLAISENEIPIRGFGQIDKLTNTAGN